MSNGLEVPDRSNQRRMISAGQERVEVLSSMADHNLGMARETRLHKRLTAESFQATLWSVSHRMRKTSARSSSGRERMGAR